MIRLSVFVDNNRHMDWHSWWVKFREYYESKYYNMDNDDDISRALKEWNAVNIPNSAEFYFENEKDYTFFLLRWA